MELKISSPKRSLSPPDVFSDPKEKEISDEDDDDRNHKHRRRETQSQSSERVALEQAFTRPYRKGNKPFENGHPYREANSQSSEMWKNGNMSNTEKDLSTKYERRRPGGSFSRASLDMNQRIRVDPLMPGDLGLGRGRGRDSVSWSQRDSRFSSADLSSQMVQQGPVPSSLFMGRGMPNVSNAQSGSWSAFGLVPGIPNSGLDTLHSLGFHTTMRPPMNPSLNIGIPRQRCRDFEERGFCLRGDMCPMEHGVNRIVIEDVQSLSQFNLPGSLPSVHLMGAPTGPVPFPAISAPSGTLLNHKGLHIKSSKPGVGDNGLTLNSPFVGGADLYDPDQPLWANDRPETSTALLALNSTKGDETEPLDVDPSEDHVDGSGYKRPVRSTGATLGSQSASLSPGGRVGNSNIRSEAREKIDSTRSSSNYMGNELKEGQEPSNNSQDAGHQGKRINGNEIGSQALVSSLKSQNETSRIMRKPSQKAQRTLFVSGVPQKNNKKEVLLSHFRRFGQVIDIYIPMNTERAFVQFSKREEAEAALTAPDAVLGNRFIKLWWANRDRITDDGVSTGDTPQPYPSVLNRVKDDLQSASPKAGNPHGSVALAPASDHPKPVVTSGPKAPPPAQKKLENLESLKEELRKKQEMLDQKRNDFKRQLDKLQKHATGLKGEIATEQAAKRLKLGTVADVAKASTPSSIGPCTVVASSSPTTEVMAESGKTAENVVSESSKTNKTATMKESSSFKQSIHPLAPVGAPFIMSKFKLDNRPTAFKIIPPLPTGLADVAVLKEYFSTFGDLSTVDIEDSESQVAGDDDSSLSKTLARISFTSRRSAELAFLNGRSWKGHDLNFKWLPSTSSNKEVGVSEIPSSLPKDSSDDKVAIPRNGESENFERRESGVEHMERGEDLPSSLTAMSSEKQSP